ncbi:MAG TPA: hypothetical protein VHV32_08460 [Candidatus Angelobacter sp.]|nr:hypothetical protein [Candidatus Angelobacter sp.]
MAEKKKSDLRIVQAAARGIMRILKLYSKDVESCMTKRNRSVFGPTLKTRKYGNKQQKRVFR